jgi:hypothetical protein
LKVGVSWPDPRFSVGTGSKSDCVTDNLTGLMWAKDADLFGKVTWQDALTDANGLSLCGYDDWRLPNRKELFSLLDYSNTPALPDDHPFENIAAESTYVYWTSTTVYSSLSTENAKNAYLMEINEAYITAARKTLANFKVWPVRGGICGSKMVILGEAATVYNTIGLAYSAAGSTDTIRAQAAILSDDLSFTSGKTITLTGGYEDCAYQYAEGFTTIGRLNIGGSDTVIVSNIIIK